MGIILNVVILHKSNCNVNLQNASKTKGIEGTGSQYSFEEADTTLYMWPATNAWIYSTRSNRAWCTINITYSNTLSWHIPVFRLLKRYGTNSVIIPTLKVKINTCTCTYIYRCISTERCSYGDNIVFARNQHYLNVHNVKNHFVHTVFSCWNFTWWSFYILLVLLRKTLPMSYQSMG